MPKMKHLKHVLHLLCANLSNPYWLHLSYFVGFSLVGLLALWLSPTSTQTYLNPLDAFYTSVSAVTITSLGSVPMQEFSEFQLVVFIILMLIGGEVFTSMLCLHLRRIDARRRGKLQDRIKPLPSSSSCRDEGNGIHEDNWEIQADFNKMKLSCDELKGQDLDSSDDCDDALEYRALTSLGYISVVYLVLVQLVGIVCISIYFSFSSSGKRILRSRGVGIPTFAVFTVVSSFANCGFTPLDDNMLPFRKHQLLLIFLAFQIMLGNTLFGPCFRAIISTLHNFTKDQGRKTTYGYILKHGRQLCDHLFSASHCVWLIFTILLFLAVGVTLILALHWDSELLEGLSSWEKLIDGVFQTLAVRHAGENVVNPELLSPAIVVLYIIMMYLPSYPIYVGESDVMNIKLPPKTMEKSKRFVEKDSTDSGHNCTSIGVQLEKLLLHDLSYLIIAVMLICITERDRISQDPLNFNILNIVFEVVSAYGNVGMSIGYSCGLFNKIWKESCRDVPYSFSGKWSAKGKIIIIMVMFLGRFKGIKQHSLKVPPPSSLKKLIPKAWLPQHFHITKKNSTSGNGLPCEIPQFPLDGAI